MTEFEDRLCGFEFDWFALDQNDNLAVFSSAGMGVVPIEVQHNYKAYDSIYSQFYLPNLGSLKIWDDLANYGFYVFDWEMNGGLYLKMGVPKHKIDADLRQQILNINGIPRLQISFLEVLEINIL